MGRQADRKAAAEKVICRALRPAEKNKNGYPAVLIFHFPGAKNFAPGATGELTFSPVEVIIIVHGTSTKNSFLYI